MSDDPLLERLAELVTDAPPELIDRIAARWVTVEGPVGEMFVAYTDQGIAYVRPAGADAPREFRRRFGRPLLRAARPPAGLVPALRTGRATGLRFDLRELSGFQAEVLRAAQTIPRGEVRPYAWIARRINRPRAVRAVGTALATNPVPLLIPCHRVTRSDGSLGEYIFGTETKRRLLRAENANLDEAHDLARKGVFYVGSDTTGVVCYPTCHHARHITPPHRKGFRTIAQAETAGYRPCRHCQPAAVEPA
ncbi:methylated-DNA--[protein]-cysteine S-methyltransferase [Thermobifida halotolerans]|uniref:methylated-DNA--[protein]-cysteine S-methyltransferase n=1 Tax=Thermobifida halotolerans TaxID=483545 RepID=A0A399G9X8_9ACTN|nr:methylated-DNA--[protein]-cysteine S-methyltransferase [Thermobifida halotolerans]UOE20728.1 methylated-DNA--[protein]-cysteine S-methyltransferase [Thermobifida halotolerans]